MTNPDITPEGIKAALEGLPSGPWGFYASGSPDAIKNQAKFIAYARNALPLIADRMAELIADRDHVFTQARNMEVAAHRMGYKQGQASSEMAIAGLGDALDKARAERDAALARVKELTQVLRLAVDFTEWRDRVGGVTPPHLVGAIDRARAALSEEPKPAGGDRCA